MGAELARAANTLALDLAAGEVVRAMNGAHIDCMLLKGPATVHRLYGEAPGLRNYGDIDLAVDPRRFDDAGKVLETLGFEDRHVGLRVSEAARQQGRSWHRDGADHVAVDLHRGFHHVTDWSAWWQLLTVHRAVLVLEGQAVTIPDPAACALIAALHASKATSQRKALEDLGRALRQFDDDVWRQAAGLARSIGACDAYAAALCRLPAGAELAARLGLRVTDPVVWLRATSPGRGAGSLSLVLADGGFTDRARRLRDVAWPSRAALGESRPIARRGTAGLVIAHVERIGFVLTRTTPLLLAWRRAARTVPGRYPAHPDQPAAPLRSDTDQTLA